MTSRNQGGTLDLHADSGQIAIEDMKLQDEFARLARPEGQSHRLLAPDGTLIAEQIADGAQFAAPEIDRGQLRTMLADSVLGADPAAIRWGHMVERIDAAADGSYTLTFGNQAGQHGTRPSPVTVDLVIGADGAWSRVRRMLTSVTPLYSGVTFAEVLFTDVTSSHPGIASLVGDGHMWANGDGRAIILQRNSGDVVRGYVGMRVELDWLARAGLGESDGRGGLTLDANATHRVQEELLEGVRAELLRRFADFAPELRAVIAESEGALPSRPIYGMPTPTSWDHVAGVAVIGDAAHVMAPFGGNGVNLAMLDGVELAHAIARAAERGEPVDSALRVAEQRMLDRSNPIAESSNAAIREHFASGGPDIESIPDWEAEAEQWNKNATAYRSESNR
jgi:2-polyprenyl-6-methoxyphenol hydroxylase-like FAD-dependent oxidoreductase